MVNEHNNHIIHHAALLLMKKAQWKREVSLIARPDQLIDLEKKVEYAADVFFAYLEPNEVAEAKKTFL